MKVTKHLYLTYQICICRWFKSFNISIASERQQRKLAKEMVGEKLVAERGAFSFCEWGKEVGGGGGGYFWGCD